MSRPPRPEISVVVPSFNKPQYLPECLESIRAQTFTDWECIVVSDGSPRVEEIRAAVAGMKDSRFRLLELPLNGGTSVARNRGAEEARAPLLVWIDEDDVVLPGFLEKLYRVLCLSDAKIACCGIEFFGGMTGRYKTHIPDLEEILHDQPLGGCGFLIRRESWQQIGGWDEHPLLRRGREDNEWWIRVVANNLRIQFCEEVLYLYRRAKEGPLTELSRHHSCMQTQVASARYIIRKHQTLYDQYPASKRQYLYKAYKNEAFFHKTKGHLRRSAARRIAGAILYASPAETAKVIRSVMPDLLGKNLTKFLARVKNMCMQD